MLRLFMLLALILLLAVVDPGSARSRDDDASAPLTLITDPEPLHLLQRLGDPLVRAAGLDPETMQYHILLEDSLNAFALEGGHLVFHSALVRDSGSVHELAGVMAHETAHLAAGHHIKLRDEMRSALIRSLISASIGVAAGVLSSNAQVAGAAIIGGQAGSQSLLLANMRDKESQADQLALRYMADSGFEPLGMASFLERLVRQQRLSHLPPPYLLTHPVGPTRISDLQEVAPPPPLPRDDLPSLEALLGRVQAKLTAIHLGGSQETIRHFNALVGPPPGKPAARYGLALARRYAGELDGARDELTALLATVWPGDAFLLRERGLIHLEQGHMDLAIADLQQAAAALPENTDFIFRLALALGEDGQHEAAARMLRRLTSTHPRLPEPLRLLGVYEGRQGHMGASHLALARHYRLVQDPSNALWHYGAALRHFPTTDAQAQVARDEMARLKDDEKRKKR
ncbi:MAG: M48 family metalloprotease [Magnetococcus sp. WYHC-3]